MHRMSAKKLQGFLRRYIYLFWIIRSLFGALCNRIITVDCFLDTSTENRFYYGKYVRISCEFLIDCLCKLTAWLLTCKLNGSLFPDDFTNNYKYILEIPVLYKQIDFQSFLKKSQFYYFSILIKCPCLTKCGSIYN